MHTIESLLKDAADLEASGVRSRNYDDRMTPEKLLAKAAWLQVQGRDSAYFIGHEPKDRLPAFKKGEEITILKGTVLTGTFPDSQRNGHDKDGRPVRIAGRTYKVKVHDLTPGYMHQDWDHRTKGIGFHIRNAEICFVGAGGYWNYVDLNDVPEAIEKFQGMQASSQPEMTATMSDERLSPQS